MTDEDKLPDFVYSCVEDWFVNLLAPTIERRLALVSRMSPPKQSVRRSSS